MCHGASEISIRAYRRAVRAGLDTYVLIGDPNAATTQARAAIKLVSAFVF